MEREPGGVAAPPQAEDVLMRSLPERYFLNLGRFVEKKNLSTLVEAYARFARASVERSRAETGNLKPEGSETADGGDAAATKGRRGVAALVLVGEGPLRGDLERQARDLGLPVRDGVVDPISSGGAEVVFYPFQQADLTPLFFALCEAFVLPSKREEWGLVVNEAMACGAPVVVSNRVGSHFDLVRDGENGFVFAPDDVEQLAGILHHFDEDPELSRRLGTEGRKAIQAWTPALFGSAGAQALEAVAG
jgi:glycosyltransferase involved in cell wall biosynthesis